MLNYTVNSLNVDQKILTALFIDGFNSYAKHFISASSSTCLKGTKVDNGMW